MDMQILESDSKEKIEADLTEMQKEVNVRNWQSHVSIINGEKLYTMFIGYEERIKPR